MALEYDVSKAKSKCHLCMKGIGVAERRAFEVVSFFGNYSRHYFHLKCAKTRLEDELRRVKEFEVS